MCQRNISPLSSGPKRKTSKKEGKSEQSVLGLLFIPDDGDDVFLQNVCGVQTNFKGLQHTS
jgi:hypothetical protein